jgi:ribonucleoside-diphosphate reductase alpha chain
VSVTDAFMNAVRQDLPWRLAFGGRVYKELSARSVWQTLVNSAWLLGDPGVIFIDRMNRDNVLYPDYVIEATNPCGEVPLLPWEACTLGSINLGNFADAAAQNVEWSRLAETVQTAIRFLDDVVTVSHCPVPRIDEMTRMTRRLGLGVMGWADLLNKLEIPYDSDEAITLADRLGGFIRHYADEASADLAKERGAFPLAPSGYAFRNVARLSIAPTGSISIIAGCSAGIEPYFARKVVRRVAIGELEEDYPNADKPWFRTAMEIAPEWHVRHQAAWQKHIDNAVSKTINLPESATQEDVQHVYELAYELGCKGITIYRDRSRKMQVYNELCPGCGSEMVMIGSCKGCPKCGEGVCAV